MDLPYTFGFTILIFTFHLENFGYLEDPLQRITAFSYETNGPTVGCQAKGCIVPDWEAPQFGLSTCGVPLSLGARHFLDATLASTSKHTSNWISTCLRSCVWNVGYLERNTIMQNLFWGQMAIYCSSKDGSLQSALVSFSHQMHNVGRGDAVFRLLNFQRVAACPCRISAHSAHNITD